LRPLLQTSQATLAQTSAVLSWLHENQDSAKSPSLQAQLDLAQQHKILHAYLAKLRGQSRRAAFGARATKQETAEARQEVDRLLLQLQNLYYEQRHLLGEIGACEDYEWVTSNFEAKRALTSIAMRTRTFHFYHLTSTKHCFLSNRNCLRRK